MKKFLFFIVLSTLCFAYDANEKNDLQNKEQTNSVNDQNNYIYDFSVQLKPAYFYPQDNKFRDIYGSGFMILTEIDGRVYENVHIWADIGFFTEDGKVDSVSKKSRIYLIPTGVGLKYLHTIYENRLGVYAKIGINYLYMKNKQNYQYVKNKTHKNVIGGTFGIGMVGTIQENFIGSVFLDYLYDKRKIHDSNSNQKFSVYGGGLVVGIGLGYCF
ncbi:MAG: hypothetical protein AMS24_01480 [Chlamydiae bacterium SM23_39]|nr:MAG: hypothetical protein AMS24_01480 [Chlamydiae bacterium SM23_39]